ncbi:MAG: hypothetical protein IIY58_02725 [Aeriscardovia sp.]|nr:hypothetical protein [Aeriscardovia sp.]
MRLILPYAFAAVSEQERGLNYEMQPRRLLGWKETKGRHINMAEACFTIVFLTQKESHRILHSFFSASREDPKLVFAFSIAMLICAAD